jgi:hypothetical protein
MNERYTVPPAVSFRQVGEEMFLLNRHESTVFNLNPTATFIWNEIAGGESLGTIIEHLCMEYDIDRESACRDVQDLIESLVKNNMVELL